MLQSVLFTVELHVTVNNIKLSVSQCWFYVEFMSPTTKRNPVFMQSARYLCSILPKSGVWQIFIYVTKIKFRKNPSSGCRAGTCRQTETTKLIDTYRDYAHAPKGGYTLVTLPRIVYRYSVDGTGDRVPYQKVGYAVTLRACSVCCRYLSVASKGWYGYGRSRCGRATSSWQCGRDSWPRNV